MKLLIIILSIAMTGCSSSEKTNITDYDRYKISENHYQGYLNEGDYSSYVKVLWTVDGNGRAIDAKIQLPDSGKIITQRIWSYDSFFKWRRDMKHKRMMLEALQWIR